MCNFYFIKNRQLSEPSRKGEGFKTVPLEKKRLEGGWQL